MKRRFFPGRIARRLLTRLIILLPLACCLRFSGEHPSPLPLSPSPDQYTLSVFMHQDQEIRTMELDAYLIRAVAAEMPADFHSEALRAQAVAARSFACFRMKSMGGSGCASCPEADICTDPACCQAYLLSGQTADPRIAAAVFSTSGEVLTYQGHVINALYHACSGGMTEASEAVFSQALPYLRPAKSPGEERYPQYAASLSFSRESLALLFPLRDDAPLSEQFSIEEYTASGRAAWVRTGEERLRGSEFRFLLRLPSARMDFSFDGDSLIISTVGRGHGVGLSQVGADAMARSGADCREILLHYYADCSLSLLP